jgi:hypothetical protein
MEDRMNQPVCERATDLVSFLYHEVDEREAHEFERHLAECDQCARELMQFRGIREGVIAWRQESLGMIPAQAEIRNSASFAYSKKPSALVAIRQFFNLSPLWLKGATAFAGILFCVAAALMVSKLQEKPQVAVTDKVYSEQELKAKVEAEVQAKIQQLNAADKSIVPKETGTPATATNHNTGNRRLKETIATGRTLRAPLTKAEREQLAADLRLISISDDSDLNLLDDQINR